MHICSMMIKTNQMEQILFTGIDVNDLLNRIGQLIDSKINALKNLPLSSKADYISRKEVAKLIMVTLPTLHDYTKQGWIKSYKIGSRVLYKSSEVHESIENLKSLKNRKGGLHA